MAYVKIAANPKGPWVGLRPRSPRGFSDDIGSAAARWSAAVKLAGIKPE
jgi:hypothetical protein